MLRVKFTLHAYIYVTVSIYINILIIVNKVFELNAWHKNILKIIWNILFTKRLLIFV